MKIVKATLSDIRILAQMNKRLIEDERHSNPMSVAQLEKRMTGWLQDAYTCYLVKKGDRSVAYCLFREDTETYYMRQLFVERGYRRNHIATRLLDWMFQNVWPDKKVRLDVLSHNKEAIAFYEAYGFRTGALRMEK